jgi:hypothetical protein
MVQTLLSEMDKRKIINRSLTVFKIIFIIGSIVMNFMNNNNYIDYLTNVFWRDINEFSCYFFILLFLIEFITKQFYQVIFSVISIAFCLYFWQSVTGGV